ncbi:hypothetical protein P3T36_005318 [Kitasatospora sp. MAP12-15]|uniref:maltokinase N-terminal cap-like domain-containing protein n=1 Tax=unclassified Kitasatospora TaxID=2633591 RepID=UPI0024749553|nr:1,4-alpha-glucan branching protein [Kitasatospora sp. MAP12-44]MDH6109881.1 hypothetical protein [Kitasatospora sp. MAP12-44]
MAIVHNTTVTPTKRELLTEWLPSQPWYSAHAGAPELVRGGGFRLDDPEGEVGIEFLVVVDTAAPEHTAYLVPMGYRGAPLEGASREALVGTCEHGVLGTRWVYDGVHDPVVTAQLRALLRGQAVAQHQDESDTLDPTVRVHGTEHDAHHDAQHVEIRRVLRSAEVDEGAPRHLVAGWTWPDGTPARGVFATTTRE